MSRPHSSTVWPRAGVAAALVLAAGCGPNPRFPVGEYRSPDGRHVAALYGEDLGSTAGNLVVVEVRPAAGVRWPWYGRVFAGESNHGLAAVRPDDPRVPRAEVRWLSATRLEVTYDRRERIGRARERVGPVAVVYRTYPDSAGTGAGGVAPGAPGA